MTAPVVTVEESAEAGEIARLLAAYNIKRVPVVRDTRIVGIVSRADLVRALAAAAPTAHHETGLLARVNRSFHHQQHETDGEKPATTPAGRAESDTAADEFRTLVRDFRSSETRHREQERRVANERRRQQIKDLVEHHIDDENWRALLHSARQAAEHGFKESMLLRFPSQLCSDGGRAINVVEADWPATLRGEAAELYLRWNRELKPKGFRLAARVLGFPGGIPGDIGLFLIWGE
jgi:hypothetical protein